MATFSRGIRSFVSRKEPGLTCARCLQFSTTSTIQSGHSRWSKIKHDKGAVDSKRTVQFTALSKEIALASKLYGGDPNFNPKLSSVLANAKKAGFPKASMEAAIARGQGKSTTGAVLESYTLEVIMPPSVALIIETETDNKARISADLKAMVKFGGGTVTPTNYLFQKRGRVVFETDDRNISEADVMDEAIEAGAEDIEMDEDGSIVVWTEPSKTMAAAEALEKSHGLKVESSDIIWDANDDTKVSLEPGEPVVRLLTFLDSLRDYPSVQGIYSNATQGSLTEEVWEEVQSKLDT